MGFKHENGSDVLIFKGIAQQGDLLKLVWKNTPVYIINPRQQLEKLIRGDKGGLQFSRGTVFVQHTPDMDLHGWDERLPTTSTKPDSGSFIMRDRNN